MNFDKNYEASEIEKKWNDFWIKNNIFSVKEPLKADFSIVLPPPNVTGELHMGHALNCTLQDVLIRYKRMRGYKVHWQTGTDHAGIGTQIVVEKQLAKEKLNKYDLGKQAFSKRVWDWTNKHKGKIQEQMKILGCSVDWSHDSFTLDPHYVKEVRQAFFKLFKENYIYRGTRLINWCPKCLTSLSDLEVIHSDKKAKLYKIKYYLNSNEFLVVATTRPETLFGDVAVAINPQDLRYKEIISKIQKNEKVFVKLPLVNKEIPVILNENVKLDFGTGALKITPSHDFNDYEIAKTNNTLEQAINIFNDKACILALDFIPKEFHGLDRFLARNLIISKLEGQGLLEGIEEYEQSQALHDRCDTVIEPYLSKQWFVEMKDLAQIAITALKTEQVKFYPERYSKTYLDWLENIQDWCISRQLWWGHEIPVFYKKIEKENTLLEEKEFLNKYFYYPNPLTPCPASLKPSPPTPLLKERGVRIKGTDIFLIEKLKPFAKEMRKEFTEAENLLWQELRNNKLGFKFRRQHLIDKFIVDFFCIETQLIIEVDGEIQEKTKEYDSLREEFLTSLGCKVIRFSNEEILNNIKEVKEKIVFTLSFRRGSPEGRGEGKEDYHIKIEEDEIQLVLKESNLKLEEELINRGYIKDSSVLDTWFSSALWAFASQRKHGESIEKPYWTNVLSTAREIINLWVSRMIFSSIKLTDKLPFKDILIHPVIQTADGKRMSKSKGNAIDPIELVNLYGADASRLWYCSVGINSNQDIRFTGNKEIENKKRFINKFWNACKFASQKLENKNLKDLKTPEINNLIYTENIYILSLFSDLLKNINNNLENYDFTNFCENLENFIWNDFCDWYLETIKFRLEQEHLEVLLFILKNLILALYPVIPFVAEELYSIFYNIENQTIAFEEYPQAFTEEFNYKKEEIIKFKNMKKLITTIRSIKKNILGLNDRKNIKISLNGEINNLEDIFGNCKWQDLAFIELSAHTIETNTLQKTLEFNDIKLLMQIEIPEEVNLKDRIDKLNNNLKKLLEEKEKLQMNEAFLKNANQERIIERQKRISEINSQIEELKDFLTNIFNPSILK